MTTYAIIDFETTGLSPSQGDRATEVAAVLVREGRVVERYQSLINPRRPIPAFVQSLTGITDSMVRTAPDARKVMHDLHSLIGQLPLIAHNASFDQKFLDAEYQRAGLCRRTEFACSMLIARRLYPSFSTHRLGDLVRQLNLPSTGIYHRAMADAEMTTHLTQRMAYELQSKHGLPSVDHSFLRQLQGISKHGLGTFVARHRLSASFRAAQQKI